jgi:hypothetical protein
LPDAVYSSWGQISKAIEKAISNPLENPIVPRTVFDVYSNAPLPKKLGIKAKSLIAILNAPSGFKTGIKDLPDDIHFVNRLTAKCDLAIWFIKSQKQLESGIKEISDILGEKSGLWIAWPKKTSGVESDLTEKIVRKIGLAIGLVDYKICSIDNIWSGLKFAHRKARKDLYS